MLPKITTCTVEGCDRKPVAGGICDMHYRRMRRRGSFEQVPYGPDPIQAADRFWPKVNKTDTCWLWTGATTNGYGLFRDVGRHMIGAHRWAYENLVGPIPDGLTIDHLCRTPLCVNPVHMEPVTTQVNTARGEGFSAKNAAKTHCPRGHEYTGLNSRGTRICHICARELSKKRPNGWARQRAQNQTPISTS